MTPPGNMQDGKGAVMTYLGTRETREAREVARRATESMRDHRVRCFRCEVATRQRNPAGMCPEGRGLASAKREADAQLKTERELDKMPIPGQSALFGGE